MALRRTRRPNRRHPADLTPAQIPPREGCASAHPPCTHHAGPQPRAPVPLGRDALPRIHLVPTTPVLNPARRFPLGRDALPRIHLVPTTPVINPAPIPPREGCASAHPPCTKSPRSSTHTPKQTRPNASPIPRSTLPSPPPSSCLRRFPAPRTGNAAPHSYSSVLLCTSLPALFAPVGLRSDPRRYRVAVPGVTSVCEVVFARAAGDIEECLVRFRIETPL